jgi:hypothetical protein
VGSPEKHASGCGWQNWLTAIETGARLDCAEALVYICAARWLLDTGWHYFRQQHPLTPDTFVNMELLTPLKRAGLSLAGVLFFVAPVMAADEPASAPVEQPEAADAAAISAPEKYDWAVTGYVARLSRDQLGDMLVLKAELEDNYVGVLALTYRIATFGPDMDWEVEGQVGKHGGSSTPSWATQEISMDHWEFNALSSVRWNKFFWDRYVDTSAAAGLGVSYATEIPEFEVQAHCAEGQCNSNRWMAYILGELAFSLPKYPRWAAVARIHHRSSMYGTFEKDIEGASNSLGLGLKYRF